jgi:PKHD-type hydroxylase
MVARLAIPAWKTSPPMIKEAAIPPLLLRTLAQHIDHSPRCPRTYQGVLDENLRKSDYAELADGLELELFRQVQDDVERHFRTPVHRIPTQKSVAYRYGPGVGFVAHHDEVTDVEREHARTNGQPLVGGDITVVTWLSGPDEYAGGALFFEAPTLEVRPPKGTVVAFPATRDYMHGVRPIQEGERTTVILRVAAAAEVPTAL